MLSLGRLRVDLYIQLSLAAALLAALWFTWSAWSLSLLLLLAGWQLLSGVQLLIFFQHQRRRRLIWMGLLTFVLGLLLFPDWRLLAWLPLATVVFVHLLQTWWEYRIVRRRPRSFWDI